MMNNCFSSTENLSSIFINSESCWWLPWQWGEMEGSCRKEELCSLCQPVWWTSETCVPLYNKCLFKSITGSLCVWKIYFWRYFALNSFNIISHSLADLNPYIEKGETYLCCLETIAFRIFKRLLWMQQ